MGAAWLALLLGGCATTSSGPVPDPAAVRRYTCFIQVEGIVAGGAIKLDGSQVSTFPGWVSVEVDESGLAVRRYVVSLSTNIIGGDLSPYVIEQGGEVPMKIFYERTGPVGTGTALVQGRH
jgi:hypothetical protein